MAFGGVDIVVNNAGITISAPVEDTTLELWNKNQAVMGTGYFLVGREGYRLLKRQNLGGSMVFICSKNAVAASPGASAYCAVKAAELHLARCMALEGAPHGIRVNVVNPDAVLRGSKIWQGPWRQQRAASLKISEDELEEHYRKRSLAAAFGLSGGYCRGRLFLRLRPVQQVDRQFPERRCGQRRLLLEVMR